MSQPMSFSKRVEEARKAQVSQRNAIRSGLEMLLVGALAAGVAYAVGALLSGLGTG